MGDRKDCKPVEHLTIADLQRWPVWEYALDRESDLPDETYVRPVADLPVSDVICCIVGTVVRLSNGCRRWAILHDLSLESVRHMEQFLTLSLWHDGKWVYRDRYFDPEYDRNGPMEFARSLGLSVDEVFPISYDVSSVVQGHVQLTRGTIVAEPKERLTFEERLRLSLGRGGFRRS